VNTIHFPRWLATAGILGGVAIALGVPYIVLAYGADLGSGAKTALIILGLIAGSLLALVTAVVGIAIPTRITDAGLEVARCCTPIEPQKGRADDKSEM
jgi:hypothetical protein